MNEWGQIVLGGIALLLYSSRSQKSFRFSCIRRESILARDEPRLSLSGLLQHLQL